MRLAPHLRPRLLRVPRDFPRNSHTLTACLSVPVALLLASAGSLSAWCGAISPNEPMPAYAALAGADVVLLSTFDRDGDREGWTPIAGVEGAVVQNGRLALDTTGRDAHLFGPKLDVDAASHQFLGLRCRTNVAGLTQVFFDDAESAEFTAGRMIPISMAATDEFVTYEIDLRDVHWWKGRIDGLRLDPVNREDAQSAHFELDWIALYQAPGRLVPLLPWWRDADTVVLGFENRGGLNDAESVDFVHEGTVIGRLEDVPGTSSRHVELDASALPDEAWVEAVRRGRTIWRGRLVRPFEPAVATSASPSSSIAVGSGAALLRGAGDRSVRLTPIASVTLRDDDGGVTYCEFAPELVGTGPAPIGGGPDDATRTYREVVDVPQRGEVTCTLRVHGGDVAATLESCADLAVLRFEGPRLLQERTPTHALLPGVEYLEAGEFSSDPTLSGPAYGSRETPPAFRVTAPVAALEYDRVAHAAAGDPRQTAWVASVCWGDGETQLASGAAPAVEFRSREGAFSFASVFLPARPFAQVLEDRFATEPQRLAAGDALELRTTYAIDTGTLEEVFERQWLPRTPAPPHLGFATPEERPQHAPRPGAGTRAALEHVMAVSMEAFTRTLYDGAGKWKSHIAIQEPHAPRPEFAAAVVAESARSGRDVYAERIGLERDTSIENLIGTAAEWAGQKRYRAACSVLASMAPDGSIPYEVTAENSKRIAEMSKFHGASGDALGVRGATNAGLIAERAMPLFEYAACTRDPIFVAAAQRALARMNSFTVPRGSQTWEIHADTPDLYAAALCARANLWGWRISGDERHLDEAQRWLRTGLPFLYWWSPAVSGPVGGAHVADGDGEGPDLQVRDAQPFYADVDRPVLPFASIPVFGTSWFAVPWYGIPVQWCGLAWANAARELDAVRPNPAYIRVADGVFRSAANQQADAGYLAGTLPDSWDLATNTSRQPYIVPERLVEYAQRALDEPRTCGIEYVRLEGGDWTHVASRSLLQKVEQHLGRLSISSRFYDGQDASLILGGPRVPLRSVTVDGVELTPGNDVGQYYWVDCGADRAVLVVRWRSRTTDHIDIEIVTES